MNRPIDQRRDREADRDAPGHPRAARLEQLGRERRARPFTPQRFGVAGEANEVILERLARDREAGRRGPGRDQEVRDVSRAHRSPAARGARGGPAAPRRRRGDEAGGARGPASAPSRSRAPTSRRRSRWRSSASLSSSSISRPRWTMPIRVGEPIDLAEDVARHEHGDAVLGASVAEQLADLDHARGVEAIGGFVEHQQLGIVEQGAGERQSLQVAERQSAGTTVARTHPAPAARSCGRRRPRSSTPARRRATSRFSRTVSSG